MVPLLMYTQPPHPPQVMTLKITWGGGSINAHAHAHVQMLRHSSVVHVQMVRHLGGVHVQMLRHSSGVHVQMLRHSSVVHVHVMYKQPVTFCVHKRSAAAGEEHV